MTCVETRYYPYGELIRVPGGYWRGGPALTCKIYRSGDEAVVPERIGHRRVPGLRR